MDICKKEKLPLLNILLLQNLLRTVLLLIFKTFLSSLCEEEELKHGFIRLIF